MGTKLQPGAFDCYAAAADDEPMFVLLARDPHAPALVRLWAMLRRAADEDEAKIAEALDCADAMARYRAEVLGRERPCRRAFKAIFVECDDGAYSVQLSGDPGLVQIYGDLEG